MYIMVSLLVKFLLILHLHGKHCRLIVKFNQMVYLLHTLLGMVSVCARDLYWCPLIGSSLLSLSFSLSLSIYIYLDSLHGPIS